MHEELLPMMFDHAEKVGCTPEQSALASLLALATVLKECCGLTDADLMTAIAASSPGTQETLQ